MSATNPGYIKCKFRMLVCKKNEFIYVLSDFFQRLLCGWNCVTLPLKASGLAENSTKTLLGKFCGPSVMHTVDVASENKDFVILQLSYILWRYPQHRLIRCEEI